MIDVRVSITGMPMLCSFQPLLIRPQPAVVLTGWVGSCAHHSSSPRVSHGGGKGRQGNEPLLFARVCVLRVVFVRVRVRVCPCVLPPFLSSFSPL